MPRNSPLDAAFVARLLTDSALPIEQKLLQWQQFRARCDDENKLCLDRMLLEQVQTFHLGLLEARDKLKGLGEVVRKLTAAPWFPAVFVGIVTTANSPRAVVQQGNARRVVGPAEGVDLNSMGRGEEVFLNTEQNVILAKSSLGSPRYGETAIFDRALPDGRLVLKWRDEDQVVDAAATLPTAQLKSGCLVRFDRNSWLAYEVIERSHGEHLFLEETPTVTFDEVGGLDAPIARIKNCLDLHLHHADTVRRYRARRKGSLLLVGPVGVGKTMVAKALANWLGRISPAGRSHFMNIKPAALHSMWFAQSEANYREVFRIAREAGEADPRVPVVMFFDEVDAIGAARGRSHLAVDDRVLNAFMAELDGLTARGNILVVAATNRRELLDPGLLRPGRLGDLVLEVPRPKMRAGREIFSKYLPPDIPYALNGHGPDSAATREEIIDAAVSRLYAPNAGNELATIKFRDGKQRVVRAADLVSGAIIANIAAVAVEHACLREVETGEAGLRLEDLQWAITEEFDATTRSLSTVNCRNHLSDLPQDVDVVSVEPILRKVARPQRYLAADAVVAGGSRSAVT